MQIRYTHKLSMHKADFLKIGKFARRFERLIFQSAIDTFVDPTSDKKPTEAQTIIDPPIVVELTEAQTIIDLAIETQNNSYLPCGGAH